MATIIDLQPVAPVSGVPIETQAESMRLLRRMRCEPAHPHELVDQMAAWANSNSLSREDMAVATGYYVEEVSRLIRETVERDRANQSRALLAAAARHMPHARLS
jgi:hypothetical protein